MVNLLVAFVLPQSADTVDLTFRAKAGSKANYALTVTGEEAGMKVTAEGGLTQEVVSISKTGFVLKSTSLGVLLRIGTDEVRDDRKTTLTMSYGFRGDIRKAEGDGGGSSFATARATRFVAPEGKVGEGSSWTFDYPKSDKWPAGKLNASVRGIEKVDGKTKVTVSFDFKESSGEKPLSSTGIWQIDAATGETISTHATIQNWMDGGAKPGTYTLVRQS